MNTDAPAPTAACPPVDTAILFAGWDDAPLGLPNTIVPLAGRPLLQRAVERLTRSGSTRIHVALGPSTQPIKDFLGDGSRWGCRIQYHTPAATETMSDFCRRLGLAPRQRYAMASASLLPLDDAPTLHGAVPAAAVGSALVWHAGEKTCWTGWGVFEGEWLLGLEIAIDHAELEASLLATPRIERKLVPTPFSVVNLADLLQSQDRLLGSATDSEASTPGRGSQVHPSARIVPPVHIGRHVRIGANAIVGPYVSIGDGALVDREAYVVNSIVLPGTYVGEGLELDGAIARSDRLANARLGTVVRVTDAHLLSATSPQAGCDRITVAERLFAMVLRVALAPLQFMISHTPAARRSTLQAHFRDSFYPGLADVGRGGLRLVGPSRRTQAEIAHLPQEWQELYAQYSSGLLNEALLLGPAACMAEMQFASDALACASQDRRAAMFKLTGAYLGQVLKSLLPATGTHRRIGKTAPSSCMDEGAGIYHPNVQ